MKREEGDRGRSVDIFKGREGRKVKWWLGAGRGGGGGRGEEREERCCCSMKREVERGSVDLFKGINVRKVK